MTFLLDANLSPRVTTALRAAGIDADLQRGAIASFSPTRLALRDLPL